jgi:hypothetical protein
MTAWLDTPLFAVGSVVGASCWPSTPSMNLIISTSPHYFLLFGHTGMKDTKLAIACVVLLDFRVEFVNPEWMVSSIQRLRRMEQQRKM